MRNLRTLLQLWLLLGILSGGCASAPPVLNEQTPRITLSFDSNWQFAKGDMPGAEAPGYSDTSWRTLSVPHDWSIEGPFAEANPAGGAGAFLPTGVGWYRKQFTLPVSFKNKHVLIDFDGVQSHSDVWINGYHLGQRPNGYVSFRYDLTGHVRFGSSQPNVLAVKVDTSLQPASRFYAGSGINRHVQLVITNPMHLAHWATFVTTPTIEANKAEVHVQTSVVNEINAQQPVTVRVTLFGSNGKVAGSENAPLTTIFDGQTAQFGLRIPIAQPHLWDINHPALYHARVQVCSGSRIWDEETVPFGIRTAVFDAATGFHLNGRNIKLKGVCLHSDGGAFGTAVPLGVWKQRLTLLKSIGCNAIRTSHNPVDPALLDLCDRMGFLVMDEYLDMWYVSKTPYDYHLEFGEWAQRDVQDSVMRDRNHPSIVLYSAGNEIHDTPNAESAKATLAALIKVYHSADPTRPVTQALLRPNATHDYDNGLADMLDVIGTNYRDTELLAAHAAVLTRKIIGTENTHDRKGWLAVRDNPPYSGQFIWTGVDYLGEAKSWPTVGAGAGLFDRTGIARARAYERQSWWSDKPMVRIARRLAPDPIAPTDPGFTPLARRPTVFCDWTPKVQTAHTENVEVYSNCEQVELILNGRSLGAQPLHADVSPRSWQVVYEPGTLQAIARSKGKVVCTDTLRTAGAPAKIVLLADQSKLSSNWNSVSYVHALVTDAQGNIVPDAMNTLTFHIDGPGVIAAVDNGDTKSHDPFQAAQVSASQGQCVAIVKAKAHGRKITISASSPGLTLGSTFIHVH